MRGLIGKKIGMTQIFNESGVSVPVTVVEAGPCVVTQVKTLSNDGYDAIQVGYQDLKEKHSNRPQLGHFKKGKIKPKRFLAEFVPVASYNYEAGQEFGVSLFRAGEYVTIKGTTKGKGFSGVLNATVPLAKMFGYATDLRSITQGRAVFHMEFSNFKEVPNSVKEEIIEQVHGKAS